MKVRDLMTERIAKALPDTTLEEIAMMMKTENTGAIPVVDEDELIGMVTDRDIILRCVAEGGDPTQMTAEDIVSEDLETIDPDSGLEEAMELMSQKQVRRLPVVDNGELIGMISLGDIAVKQNDPQGSGRALQQVSQGVKESYPRLRPQRRALLESESQIERAAPSAIQHRNASEEVRQSRVIPFRTGGDLGRGGKKSSKDKAS